MKLVVAGTIDMTSEQWNNIPIYSEYDDATPEVPYLVYKEYVVSRATYHCRINKLGNDNQYSLVWYEVRVK